MTFKIRGLTALLLPVLFAACASTPKIGENARSAVFDHSLQAVHSAAQDGLAANGFEITKNENDYLEGFRNRKVGLLVGSGGETAGVWLSPLDPNKTRVQVSTAKSFVGIAGQKNWDDEILEQMRQSLSNQ